MPERTRPLPFPHAVTSAAVAALLLWGTVPAGAAEAPSPAPKKPLAAAAPAPKGSGAALRVYVDPKTGQLLPAPPEGESTASVSAQEAVEPVAEERLPNGGIKARVPRRLMHFATATVAPDGSVAATCAPGHDHGGKAAPEGAAREK